MSKVYGVAIEEVLEKWVYVKANSAEDAKEMVEQIYRFDGEISLDGEDFLESSITVGSVDDDPDYYDYDATK